MAVIQPKEIAESPDNEEARHEVIASAIIGNVAGIPGIECVRGFAPLVILALQVANNPYITNRKGFAAMGVEFVQHSEVVEGKQVLSEIAEDNEKLTMLMMPKTAEVLVLLSCSHEELKRYAVRYEALQDAALDLMAQATLEQLAEATNVVSAKLHEISKARATKSSDDEKPGATTITERDGKKKPVRTG